MAVIIGHAAGDERGKASGGRAGDQTGREVYTRTWYDGNWSDVLRPRSEITAELMAWACECACANPNIGYDQGQRNTLKDEAIKVGFDLSKITTPCETDCSALMTVCAEAAGLNVAYTTGAYNWKNAPVTQNMVERFMATGAFENLTGKKYLKSSDYLRRGDVLVRRTGHTAMVLTNGPKEGDDMTGEEIYRKLQDYLKTQSVPGWAKDELQEAVNMGVTDGTNPMQLIPRYQAALMAKRVAEIAANQTTDKEDDGK